MKYFNQFILGGFAYALLEILYRGYTHFSMFIAGGICFGVIILLSQTGMPFLLKCVAGGLAVCAVEFAAGMVVNVWLKLNVWDYTHYGYHIMGQVCLRYLIIWSGLSGLVMLAYPFLTKALRYSI